MKYFGKKNLVIVYDVRGHGESTNEQTNHFGLDDLHHILQSKGIDQFNLVGLSLGAIIALDYTLSHPEKVQQLVLASPSLLGFQEKNADYLAIIQGYVKALQTQNTSLAITQLTLLTTGRKSNNSSRKNAKYINQSLENYI